MQNITLPTIEPRKSPRQSTPIVLGNGEKDDVRILNRSGLSSIGMVPGPLLLVDPDSTAFVPPGWAAKITTVGGVSLDRIAPGGIK